MSEDIEPVAEPQAATADPWAVWWFRFMQVGGFGGFVHELVVGGVERKWLLLVCVAMMIGGQGLNLIVRAVSERMAP